MTEPTPHKLSKNEHAPAEGHYCSGCDWQTSHVNPIRAARAFAQSHAEAPAIPAGEPEALTAGELRAEHIGRTAKVLSYAGTLGGVAHGVGYTWLSLDAPDGETAPAGQVSHDTPVTLLPVLPESVYNR